jgi:integrase
MARSTDNIKGIYCREGIWAIDCQFRGQRLRQAIGPDKAQAIDALRLWKARVIDETYFPNRAASSLTCTAVLSAYWTEHLQFEKYGPIARYYLDTIDDFFGSMPVKGLTPLDVQDYIRRRSAQLNNRKEPISPTTIRHELGILLQALRHCTQASKLCKIAVNPLAGIKRPKRAEPMRIALDDGTDEGKDWERLFAEVCPADQGVVLALYQTAMRPSEAFSMRWSWIEEISEDRWLIRVPAESEKTGRGREIPVSQRLIDHLKTLQKSVPDALVFPNCFGEHRRTIKTAFAGAVDRAGLGDRGLTPYCLRRTRISIWDSIDPAAARVASGHSRLDVHEAHYVRIGRARLFRLVGLPLETREEFKIAAA